MKIYLCIYFMLFSLFVFGQGEVIDAVEGTEEINLHYLAYSYFLEPGESFFAHKGYNKRYKTINRSYNHFQELFPSTILKKLNITQIQVELDDGDDIPTIRVQRPNHNHKFILNNDGFVIKLEKDPISIDYFRDAQNRLIIKNNSRCVYKYDLLVSETNDNDSTIYNYDEESRITDIHRYIFYPQSDSIISRQSLFYDYNNATFTAMMKHNDFDIIYYNNKWQPIHYLSTLRSAPYDAQLTYENNKIIKFVEIITYHDYEIGATIDSSSKVLFRYNKDNLIDKVTLVEDDNEQHYNIYYHSK